MPELSIVPADLENPGHARAVVSLLDAYARDPMGDGKPLPEDVKDRLIPGLKAHPTTLVLLAFAGEEAVGIAACFRGFSTFAAKPLINIHDLAVMPAHRGRGVGRRLLEAVEAEARRLGCCKLTLEVLEGNAKARRTYAAAGFAQASYAPEAGGALFLAKPLK